MSINVAIASRTRSFHVGQIPAWAGLGIWVYAVALLNGSVLLRDSDTYWQIATGKWIIDHQAMPRVDIYSFTKLGEPWISSSWLAQVLYAQSYELAGWAGPVVLAAIAIAAAFSLFTFQLARRISANLAVVVGFTVVVLSADHLLARPHVLVLPVMVAWASGLLSASEQRCAPSLWLLPLMALWANLHGSFMFGLVLVGGFALDALWNAESKQRWSLTVRWIAFGIGALAACCATPYGWETFLASRKILELGELLNIIAEWKSVDFNSVTSFEVAILAMLAGALYSGVKLSSPRVILVLGLLHMALSHVRNIEIFVLLAPLVVLGPVSTQFGLQPAKPGKNVLSAMSAILIVAVVAFGTVAYATRTQFVPNPTHAPQAAVDVLKSRNAKRVLNDLPFAGYLIARGVPVFLDGRAELYGERFEMTYFRALQLKDPNALLELLKRYDIDAVLLWPSTPAAGLLDHLAGWQRAYADENAVLHIRTGDGAPGVVDRGASK